jgi:16S rRNA (guanine966-N2)-methyltransferase
MKDRVREAVFNLLGPAVKKKAVIDFFAGTGAMGLEALSRGACRATLIERRFPTARLIEENAAHLGVTEEVNIIPGDAFVWAQMLPESADALWLVFFCPPYSLYVTRRAEMLGLIGRVVQAAPTGSLFVVESDDRFDSELLPQASRWDVRRYAPAVVAILEKEIGD